MVFHVYWVGKNKTLTTSNVGEDVEQRKLLHIADGRETDTMVPVFSLQAEGIDTHQVHAEGPRAREGGHTCPRTHEEERPSASTRARAPSSLS